VDTSKIDYEKLNLNKLSDRELAKHKKAMDTDFNKNKIWKEHPDFKYDVRKDFSKIRADIGTVEDW
jgi:hypothetical protein